MGSPYENLGEDAFWRTGAAAKHPLTISEIYRKKFDILPDAPTATAGSCFAQQISKHMRAAGFAVMNAEPAPKYMAEATKRRFGYEAFSARYGNIYTVRHLLQLAREAFGELKIKRPEALVWEKDGRFFDAMRPAVEPDGLASVDEVLAHRKEHLAAVRRVFSKAKLLVFTFGLTEYWEDSRFGLAYPTAPGTIAGEYDPDIHLLRNADAVEILGQFLDFKALIEAHNPQIKFLLTVSPVWPVATASGAHILKAAVYTKSVLRAVAGKLEQGFPTIDYFPSYDLIASPFSRGMFYEPNLRAINPAGIEAVLALFFAEHGIANAGTDGVEDEEKEPKTVAAGIDEGEDDEAACEEELLEAFAPR